MPMDMKELIGEGQLFKILTVVFRYLVSIEGEENWTGTPFAKIFDVGNAISGKSRKEIVR